jgi:ParB family chromosome partitioning protein
VGGVDLEMLMGSIRRYGVIEPIIVTPSSSGDGYDLVVGRRRLECCRRLGSIAVPSIVRRVSDDRARELSFQSNLQVAPLSIADEVDFLRRMDVFHLADSEIADRFGLSEDEVEVARRFNRLPPPIREAVRTGELDERRAMVVARLDQETDKSRLFRYIRTYDPPVDLVEDAADRIRAGQAPQL